MAQSAKLSLTQSQKLALTPQLMQSIELLQMNMTDLQAWVAEQVEKNPILEIDNSSQEGPPERRASAGGDALETKSAEHKNVAGKELDAVNWEHDRHGEDGSLAEANTFGDSASDRNAAQTTPSLPNEYQGNTGASENLSDLEAYVADTVSMVQALAHQAAMRFKNTDDLRISQEIITSLDEDGYLRRDLDEIAVVTGAERLDVESVLEVIQGFEPAGIGAQTLAQCMEIQLREKNRFDPAMASLVAHLPLLARRDFDALGRLCGVSREDLVEMIQEIQLLDPRPGQQFERKVSQNIVPDVFVSAREDGGWHVEMNSSALPRVLINREYYADIKQLDLDKPDRKFMVDQLQDANWLVASLDQRARTILQVATEIVRQQDAFFVDGVEHLKPLNLKTVAKEIQMHESTVSRVTSNKYLMCPSGLFELKFFFSSRTASGSDAVGGTAIKARMRRLIDAESAQNILSDEKIVSELAKEGITIARRTVMKYREQMGVLSSIERRREKNFSTS